MNDLNFHTEVITAVQEAKAQSKLLLTVIDSTAPSTAIQALFENEAIRNTLRDVTILKISEDSEAYGHFCVFHAVHVTPSLYLIRPSGEVAGVCYEVVTVAEVMRIFKPEIEKHREKYRPSALKKEDLGITKRLKAIDERRAAILLRNKDKVRVVQPPKAEPAKPEEAVEKSIKKEKEEETVTIEPKEIIAKKKPDVVVEKKDPAKILEKPKVKKEIKEEEIEKEPEQPVLRRRKSRKCQLGIKFLDGSMRKLDVRTDTLLGSVFEDADLGLRDCVLISRFPLMRLTKDSEECSQTLEDLKLVPKAILRIEGAPEMSRPKPDETIAEPGLFAQILAFLCSILNFFLGLFSPSDTPPQGQNMIPASSNARRRTQSNGRRNWRGDGRVMRMSHFRDQDDQETYDNGNSTAYGGDGK